ncbi:extracellular solute-binding protein [Cryptosporangium japonicum]|uniref:ABC transporter substrate-binding protein n=1 Tax=Cryptosporangium japonicum TaxID=80872 RepID=A0ABN0TLP4_9ACTN
MPTDRRYVSGLGEWYRAGRDRVEEHRGRSGLVAGVLIGVLLAVTAVYAVPRLLDSSWEDGELVLLSGQDDSVGDQRQQLIDEWNALHPDHRVRIEEVRSIADAERGEMLARAGGDGPAVDVLNLDVAWLPEFAEAGLLRRIADEGVDRGAFLAGPLATCEYDGRLWALPFNTDAALLYRRKDYLPTAPPSWTSFTGSLDTLFKGNALQQAGPRAGLVTQLGDYEGLTVNALEMVWAAGGEIVDENGEVRVDSRAAQNGLNYLVDGVKTEPRRIYPGSVGYAEADSTSAFLQDQAMYLRNWPLAYRALEEQDRESGRSAQDSRYAVSALPWPSVLGGQNLAVAERSRHPRAARALIGFLTDSRSQQILFERGGFAATRKVVYQDAEVRKNYRYAAALLQSVERARPRPRSPHYALFSEVLRGALHEGLVTGVWPPPHLAEDLRAALRGQRR